MWSSAHLCEGIHVCSWESEIQSSNLPREIEQFIYQLHLDMHRLFPNESFKVNIFLSHTFLSMYRHIILKSEGLGEEPKSELLIKVVR